MTTKLIGVTGRARSGKDVFAAARTKYGYARIAFADALKTVTAFIANEQTHLYHDDISKEEYTDTLGMTRRLALQKVGVAVRESLGKETWVRRALQGWVTQGCPPTVVSDVRFDNEAQAIRDLGGIIVRINRDHVGLTGESSQHESENGIDDNLVDVDVFNDGTVGELVAEAKKIAGVVMLDEHTERLALPRVDPLDVCGFWLDGTPVRQARPGSLP